MYVMYCTNLVIWFIYGLLHVRPNVKLWLTSKSQFVFCFVFFKINMLVKIHFLLPKNKFYDFPSISLSSNSLFALSKLRAYVSLAM